MHNFENSEHFNHVMKVQCSEASCRVTSLRIIFGGMHKFRASDCVHHLGTSFTYKFKNI